MSEAQADNSSSVEKMPIDSSSNQSANATSSDPNPIEESNTKKGKAAEASINKKRKVADGSVEAPQTEEAIPSRKPPRPRSWTWEHFTKEDSDKARAKCKWCGASYACDSHRNGTTNLKNHLLNQCKKFPKEDPNQPILTLQQLKKDGKSCSALTGVSFDPEECRKALARMIIVDELPFKFVEGEGFRFYMSVVQPKLSIPGRITVARDCWNLYLDERSKLKSVFIKSNQSVCLTTDCWTSVQNLSYLCLTAHFIDQDWKLQKRILNFCPIKNHKGETIGRRIEKCLEEWAISRVFTITVDNASSNDVAIAYLKSRMEDWNSHPIKGEYMHVRCCAHILNLVVNDGLKDMHSSISKIRNAVRYVRASPSRLERFKTCIKEARIQDKCCVQLDVPTRWNSTYIMLESALKFQKAFKRLGERDAEFVMMQGGVPKNDDWENAKCFIKFLKIFYDITNRVSGSNFVTSSLYFQDFCVIMTTFKKWIGSDDHVLSSMAEKMKAKHDKYWGNVKNVNMMIFVAVVLDPRNKLRFVDWSLHKIFEHDEAECLSNTAKETLYKMFEKYRLFVNQGQATNVVHSSSELLIEESESSDNLAMAMEFQKEMNLSESMNKNEVDLYLMEALEKVNPKFDLLNWWKVNSTKYPILSQIAKDVLAMPVSTVASESAFSTGGRVLNNYRSSLTAKTVEALICTQNWLRSTPIPSDVEEMLEQLESLEMDVYPYSQQNEVNSGDESD